MSEFSELLERRVLICDGAMGTMLHAAGNSLHRSLPELNLSNPDLVSTVHESYVDAGADILLTNTFGASRIRLDSSGLADRVAELNVAAVDLARAAAGRSERRVFVAGSVSPAVGASQRSQVHPQHRMDALAEQVKALHDGGVDLLVFETFGFLDELIEAITIAADFSDLPIIAQATFSPDGLTFGGETPMVVASRLSEQPIVALGVNCTVGPQQVQSILEQLVRHSRLPVTAQPNAGLPRRVAGGRFEYIIDDAYFARYARRYAATGAAIVGGCCGTTPNHIRAAVEAVADLRTRARRRPAAVPPSVLEARVPVEAAGSRAGLAARLAQGQFSVVAQIRADNIAELDRTADFIDSARASGVDLFYVADQPSARARADAVSVALNLQYRCGIDPIATATTWDKTIMTLQAALLGVHALGLRTIVCERAIPRSAEITPNSDGIWEVDSIGMIGLLAGLNSGRDFSGLSLGTKTSFHIGARFNPGAATGRRDRPDPGQDRRGRPVPDQPARL